MTKIVCVCVLQPILRPTTPWSFFFMCVLSQPLPRSLCQVFYSLGTFEGLRGCEEGGVMMMVVRMERGSWHIMKG